MSLADRLYDLRKNAKVSLQAVADAVGVSKAHVWELEKERSKNPSFELVQKLATYYGVSAEELAGAASVPSPEDQRINRIHRDLKGLSPRDLALVESMVRSMKPGPDGSGEE
ncbi:helix-turn-helix domain-containing protein [Neotabrizicola sp. sgz301269]|uniref:helix-turn-helix domain-containing protein n=1 Tax=Neotabrizicola sp. sgz301269 TaxID=3276282 RepID=UPI0037705F49